METKEKFANFTVKGAENDDIASLLNEQVIRTINEESNEEIREGRIELVKSVFDLYSVTKEKMQGDLKVKELYYSKTNNGDKKEIANDISFISTFSRRIFIFSSQKEIFNLESPFSSDKEMKKFLDLMREKINEEMIILKENTKEHLINLELSEEKSEKFVNNIEDLRNSISDRGFNYIFQFLTGIKYNKEEDIDEVKIIERVNGFECSDKMNEFVKLRKEIEIDNSWIHLVT